MSKTYCSGGKPPACSFGHRYRRKKWLNTGVIFKYLVVLGVSFCFFGCAHKSPGTYQHTEAVFSKTGKISVMKFNNIESPAYGQEAANLLALAFMHKGYSVIDASNVLSVADQDKLYSGVLTNEIKTKFKNNGVNAIVMGTIHDYSCTNVASNFLALFSINSYSQLCRTAISVKMIKLDSGELLWGVSRSGEDGGDNINAGNVLRNMIQELENELPADAIKQPDK